MIKQIWSHLVWKHCVNEQDKLDFGEQAIPDDRTVWWYRIELTMLFVVICLMALPGELSVGAVWLPLFIYIRAWTVRSTRQSYSEMMNQVIYEPHQLMQVIIFGIPSAAFIAWILALGASYVGSIF